MANREKTGKPVFLFGFKCENSLKFGIACMHTYILFLHFVLKYEKGGSYE